jgi:curved DNA-binding protein CbpA
MNSRQAYKVLELEPGAAHETIRRQYKMLALKYHPDKNKAEGAADKYREIKEAHDVLCSSNADPLDHSSVSGWFSTGSSTYARTAADFFEMIYNDEQLQRRIFHPLLMRVVGSCEEKALDMFKKMEKKKARKLYDILILYQDTLHLSADILVKIRDIVEGAESAEEGPFGSEGAEEPTIEDIVVLNPNIDDLLNQSVYKLKQEDGTILFVPLWHRELEYDGVFVDCLPMLPDNVGLDEHNNIHVNCLLKAADLWDKEEVEVLVGSRAYNLDINRLRLVSKQVVQMEGMGIPVPNEADIFNVSRLSSVYAHVEIEI